MENGDGMEISIDGGGDSGGDGMDGWTDGTVGRTDGRKAAVVSADEKFFLRENYLLLGEMGPHASTGGYTGVYTGSTQQGVGYTTPYRTRLARLLP